MMTGLSLIFLSASELTLETVTSLLATVRTPPLLTPSLRFHLVLLAVSARSDILTRTSRVKMSSEGGLKPCLQ